MIKLGNGSLQGVRRLAIPFLKTIFIQFIHLFLVIASIRTKPRCWLLTASAQCPAPVRVIPVTGNYPGMFHHRVRSLRWSPLPPSAAPCRGWQEVAGDYQIPTWRQNWEDLWLNFHPTESFEFEQVVFFRWSAIFYYLWPYPRHRSLAPD